MQTIGALIAGLLFGLGLLISGLAHPDKVQAFLDIGGLWDPSLALVMGGAIAVASPFFLLINKNGLKPTRNITLHLPTRTNIDKNLLIGSALFGVGWGLVGYCPGPALVSSGSGIAMAWWFLPAMVVGSYLQEKFSRKNLT